MTMQVSRPRWGIPLAVFAAIFGFLTLKSGGEVLFIDGAGRARAGHFVPFVLWFNFLAGFAYVAAAVGIYLQRSWATPLAFGIAVLTLVVFAAFGVHILMDGEYEIRTVGAMTLRSVVWIGIAWFVRSRLLPSPMLR